MVERCQRYGDIVRRWDVGEGRGGAEHRGPFGTCRDAVSRAERCQGLGIARDAAEG